MAECPINPQQNVFKKYRQVNYINSYVFGVSIDADAQAFITAVGLTDPTHISAINTLVVALKGYSIWTKFKAIYPIIGGTEFTHKWNLKDPRDLNAAFRLDYAGTLTHDSNGITGSTNGYAVTYINANTLTASSNHLSNYCSTNTFGAIICMGGAQLKLSNRYNSNARSDNPNTDIIFVSNSDSRGFYLGTRNSTTSHKIYKNSSILGSSTALITTALTSSIIGLLNPQDTGSYYSNRRYGWFSIGDGLSDTEEANLYTAVQAYQTTLGRQV